MGKLYPFKLNLPQDVAHWLRTEAEQNLRSKSNEVILALREKMEGQKLNTQKSNGAEADK